MTGVRELRQGRKAATVAAPSGCRAPAIDLYSCPPTVGGSWHVLFGLGTEVATADF